MRAFLPALALLGGCSLVFDPSQHTRPSSVDAGLDASRPSFSAEEFCEQAASTWCEAAAGCCTAGTRDVDACTRGFQVSCGMIYGAAAASPDVRYDGAAAYAALETLGTLVSTCSVEASFWFASRQGIFAGLAGDIPGGNRCDPRALTEIEVLISIVSCADGQVCRATTMAGTEWICRAPGTSGTSCSYAIDCGASAPRCARTSDGSARTCGPGRMVGEPCLDGEECASGVCSGGDVGGVCLGAEGEAVYCAAFGSM